MEQIDHLLLSRRPTSLLALFHSDPARQTLDRCVSSTTEWSPDLPSEEGWSALLLDSETACAPVRPSSWPLVDLHRGVQIQNLPLGLWHAIWDWHKQKGRWI